LTEISIHMEFGETGTWPEDLWKVRARADMRMIGEAGSNRWHFAVESHSKARKF